ncbi:F-box/LRR-repeat protein 15-like isoform X2 [Daphnia pulicaria]|uniref:F-box/LRR-repeat protein 15-like isoform X2 n=1 Tax=Daphnia pulicaria TaxID=35523 RepID=UPI001EECAF83|nr:F-box/LRR-repeat protein 15-like isoform X2 [Daphnia pulicaria]
MKENIQLQMHLLDLPGDDIILKIIDYLSPQDWLNFRCVSKQTYFLVHEYFKYMKYLDLSHHKVLPQALCQVLPQLCHSLKVFKISNSKIFNDECIKTIIQNNHNLNHLDLSNSNLKNGTLQPLVVNCKKLEKILLKNCVWLTVGAIEILAFHFPDTIKVADFSGCTGISEASIILFVKRQPKLISLSLSDLSCLQDETLVKISQFCPQLVYLDISRCCRITDSGIKKFAEYCHTVRTLKVDGCEVSERSLSWLRSRGVWIDKPQYPSYLLHRLNQIQTWPRTQL